VPKPIVLTKEDIANFWTRVEKHGTNECWTWRGSHDKDGYGVYHHTIGKWYKAHRIACFLKYGTAGSMCCHKCNNPGCVNPKHLYPGSGKLNSADRDKIPHGIHGEQCHLAKLTNKQVKLIVKLHQTGKTNTQIANVLGIKRRLIERICAGECWVWLTGIKKKHGILYGENSPVAKFTNKQVLKIIKLRQSGQTIKQIACYFRASESTIRHICKGECWNWLTGISKK
jgi:hypothetical protein